MKTVKLSLTYLLLALIVILTACTEERQLFPFIESIPCDNVNVVADLNIISDFECQANLAVPDVEAILNPDESGINPSRFVGKYIDPTGPWDALIIDYGGSIDLSTYNTFKIKVKTTISGILKVKLEGGASNGIEKDANITNTQNWVEYTFDFSDQFNQSHNKLVIFFNAGVDTSGSDLYYIDDLRFETTNDPCVNENPDLNVVNDFDCQQNQDVPEVEIIATPNKNDVNSSKFSGKYIDEVGAWDAVIIDYGAAIDLSTSNVFSIKVKAPVEGVLKVKLEGGSSNGFEVDALITNTSDWVEYTYDFSSQANENHNKIVLFFNAGVDTDGTDVYYIDDLKFTELTDPCIGVSTDLSIINDFNCQQNAAVGGSNASLIVDNPNLGSNNPSNAVLQVTDNGTDAWDALVFDFGGPIDLTTNNFLKIKVLSTREVPLLAKLEAGTSPAKEVWGAIDVVGDWTEYSFDFSDQANENHNKIVFFFNGGQVDGTANDIYYIDDVKFGLFDPCSGTATDVSIVNDFECQQNYSIPGFLVNSIVANPDISGINTSSSVLKVTDNGTEPWDALLFEFGQSIDLSVKNHLKIKILSTRAVPLLAKLEGGTSPAKEVWGSITTTGAWTEYSFDFSDQATENQQTLVFFFNGGENTGTATDIYYIDDIKWEKT